MFLNDQREYTPVKINDPDRWFSYLEISLGLTPGFETVERKLSLLIRDFEDKWSTAI